MRDLIDREAALNCYHSWVDQYGDVYTPDEIPEYQAIEALPSAQPECSKEFVMLKVRDLNGRPYYSIIYLEEGCEHEGYASYDLMVISEYLKRYFGFAQPEKRTETHACDCISRKAAIEEGSVT